MPYKQNRLRLKQKALSKLRSEQGNRGNEVKRSMMKKRGSDLEVVGWMRTGGNLGDHFIEVLACDDPTHVWIKVDGVLRAPRTCAGVKRIVGEWLWKSTGERKKG